MLAGTGGIHPGLIKYGGNILNKLRCPEEEGCGPEKGLLWRRGRILVLLLLLLLLLL